MTRRWPRTLQDEIAEMWNTMDSLTRRFLTEPTVPQHPGGEKSLLPLIAQDNLRIDVIEHDGDVTVTVDMIPGVTKEGICLELVNPTTLRIACERSDEKKDAREGYYLCERRFGSVCRIVPLPVPVTDQGATSTFKNGVLEVTLKKSQDSAKSQIPIE